MPRPRRVIVAAGGVAGLIAVAIGSAVGVAHGLDPASGRRHPPAAVAAPMTHQRPLPDRADRSARDETVLPLRRLTTPDVLVTIPRPAVPARVWRLEHRPGVLAVAVLDRGHLRVRGRTLPALGVSANDIRGFTPALTARSDALWQSVARGELAVTYSESHRLRRSLGTTMAVRGPTGRRVLLRLGAFASLGLGRATAVVDHVGAHMLGLHRSRELVVSAPQLPLGSITAMVQHVFGRRAIVHGARPETVDQSALSDYARATIPSSYLALYRAAATTCAGLPWTVLAAIGAVETGHGVDTRTSIKGAVGPMQFLPSTFAAYGVDGGGDGVVDIHDPADAVYSAARYLCFAGAGRGGQALYDAIWAYNHADWYVREVLAYAVAYS